MTNRADQSWPDEMITEIDEGNCSGAVEGFPITTLTADFLCVYMIVRAYVRELTVNQREGL
jgi:hypothetical protein